MTDINKLTRYAPEELLHELRARKQAQVARETRGARPGEVPRELISSGIELREDLREIDSPTLAQALKSKQKVIYGVDDRQDLYEITDQAILNDADGVVSLFSSYSINDNGNGTSTLVTERFQTSHSVCDSEPFKDQPTGAFCTGFLVGPDLIATAGHCVDSGDVTNTLFVFGFRMNDSTTAQTVIDNNDIYRGVSIVGREMGDNGTDWSLVRLDRRVTNHTIVDIRREGTLADDQAVHVIGHPCGLPLKVAGGSHCRDNTPSAYFTANLDTYGGNSGSPVFNSHTHQVEGILVRGETDFVWTNDCAVSNVCPNTGCSGEDCTRTTEFAELVPDLSSFQAGRTPNSVTHDWYPIGLTTQFDSAPVLVASMQTFDGSDPAGVRIQNLTSSSLEVKIEEEQSKDNETNHISEVVGYVAVEPGKIYDFLGNPIGEANSLTVNQANGTTWHTVSLQNTYCNPVVLMQIATFNGTQPAHTRLRNVSSSSFEFQIEEWDYLDQKHTEEIIGYLVIERRTHQLSDGRVLKTGVIDTDHNWIPVSFGLNFSSIPIVISHCQTYNGNQAIVTRQKKGTTKGFHLRLQEEEARTGVHAVEKIGYIAITQ